MMEKKYGVLWRSITGDPGWLGVRGRGEAPLRQCGPKHGGAPGGQCMVALQGGQNSRGRGCRRRTAVPLPSGACSHSCPHPLFIGTPKQEKEETRGQEDRMIFRLNPEP